MCYMTSQVIGEELSPGIKKGGYLNLIQRRVKCVGPASAIPKDLELDVSSLDFGQKIMLSALSIPPEVTITGVVSHLTEYVALCPPIFEERGAHVSPFNSACGQKTKS